MPYQSNIVEGSLERERSGSGVAGAGAGRRGAGNSPERLDRGFAVAAVLHAIPAFVWATPLVLLFGFIILALVYQRGHLEDFTSGVLLWLSRVLIAGGVVLVGVAAWKIYKLYHAVVLDRSTRRIQAATERKQVASARNAELKNDQLEAKIDLERQLPTLMLWALQNGYAAEYNKDGLKLFQSSGVRVSEAGGQPALPGSGVAGLLGGPAGMTALPTNISYEEVRAMVPNGHFLVGVAAGGRVLTKERAVGACVWIVGLSGTGKTSTTVLRVEERAALGAGFLGVDPHWFKDDSLFHAIYELEDKETGGVSPGPYQHLFLRPMACTASEQLAVLKLFLGEFNARKSGRRPKDQWRPVYLLVDEVGALIDPTTPEEEEIKTLLPTIARVCGQEARNFMMGGIFISQQATGLAWLRKMALMIFVHQLLMESEKLLAVNNNKEVAKDMERWPVGRTFVYGVGFNETGPVTVQQPYFKKAAAADAPEIGDGDLEENRFTVHNDQSEEAFSEDEQEAGEEEGAVFPAPIPALSGDLRIVYDAVQQLVESGRRVSARELEALTGFKKDKANNLLNRLETLGYINRRAV
jgi:hypothetical protein